MNKKLVIVVIMALILTIGTVSYASKGVERTEEEKFQNKVRVDEMLNEVNSEVKKDFGINNTEYIELDTKTLNAVLNNELDTLKDQELSEQLNKIFRDSLIDFPVGSTKPTIMVNKNRKEIIFGYKDKDGNNILEVFTNSDESWIHEYKHMKGEPIPQLNLTEKDYTD